MFVTLKPKRPWSDIGLIALVTSIAALIALIIADGLIKASSMSHYSSGVIMIATWVIDFRYFFEQGVYASTVFFVGAKFFETRTMLTVGFDKLDAKKISIKAPDADNIVWIGHAYANPIEATAVFEAFSERLKQSA
jgi:hypothetical protein